jgi:hypothetical protein
MDVLSSVQKIFEIIDLLHKKFTELRQADAKRIRQVYKLSIEPSFQQLTTIHDDYTANLSKLRDYLRDRSLPPRDLLRWLRDAGLRYRSVRENLSTIDADLRSIATPEFERLSERHGHFMLGFRRYVRSIIEYYRCTISWHGLSLYRDSEHTLQTVFDSVRDDEAQDNEVPQLLEQFYKHASVTDLTQELTTICDVRLPQYWQAVCRAFREVKMHAGDAACSNSPTD